VSLGFMPLKGFVRFCAIVREMRADGRRWLVLALISLMSARLLNAQDTQIPPDIQKLDPQKLGFTGYPPMTYDHIFLSCPSDGACTRTDKFRVDPMPPGCCILTVRNGDGRGTDEVRSYEIVLNDQRVASSHARHTNVPVKLRTSNTIRVVLSAGPQSKLWVFIAYDPRQSK
jgi:hypothetical protein